MSKRAQDYYEELKREAQNVRGFGAPNLRPQKNMRRKPFPLTLFMLLFLSLFFAAYIYSDHDDVKWAYYAVKKGGGVKAIVNRLRAGRAQKTGQGAKHQNGQYNYVDGSYADGSAKGGAHPQTEFEDTHVYIEGQYYKKSPDNIYYVNGRKIYYVNNRKRGPAAPTPVKEEPAVQR